MIETRKFLISGLVQGVCFRSFAADAANDLNITGWVRNTDDGCVELLAHGNAEQIQRLELALWKGPRLAKIHSIESELSQGKVPDGFSIVW